MVNLRISLPFLIFGQFLLLTAASAQTVEVAGLQPDRRPAGAPVIKHFDQSDAWKAQAVKGIDLPHTGLGFLKDQGAWYTPFNQPNMPGRYDIRRMFDTNNRKE